MGTASSQPEPESADVDMFEACGRLVPLHCPLGRGVLASGPRTAEEFALAQKTLSLEALRRLLAFSKLLNARLCPNAVALRVDVDVFEACASAYRNAGDKTLPPFHGALPEVLVPGEGTGTAAQQDAERIAQSFRVYMKDVCDLSAANFALLAPRLLSLRLGLAQDTRGLPWLDLRHLSCLKSLHIEGAPGSGTSLFNAMVSWRTRMLNTGGP